MKRLTFHEPDGRFGVAGMNEENQDDKMYMCVVKLKDYEDTGLNPDDIRVLNNALEDYKKTGLSPEQLKKELKCLKKYRELGTIEELEKALYDAYP